MRGGQYLIGYYDRKRDRFIVDTHGLYNFGVAFPGGVNASSATTDETGSIIVLFNMNPAKPTNQPDNFLSDFFSSKEDSSNIADGIISANNNWDQI